MNHATVHHWSLKILPIFVRSAEFSVMTPDGAKPALYILHEAFYHREDAADADKFEYFVPVDWLETVSLA